MAYEDAPKLSRMNLVLSSTLLLEYTIEGCVPDVRLPHTADIYTHFRCLSLAEWCFLSGSHWEGQPCITVDPSKVVDVI